MDTKTNETWETAAAMVRKIMEGKKFNELDAPTRGLLGSLPGMREEHPDLNGLRNNKIIVDCLVCKVAFETTLSKRGNPSETTCPGCIKARHEGRLKAHNDAREAEKQKVIAHETAALLQDPDFRNSELHVCEYCELPAIVRSGWNEEKEYSFRTAFPTRWQGAELVYISYRTDPFQEEIRDDHTLYWLCDRCARAAADEI